MDAYTRDLAERYPGLDPKGRILPRPEPVNPGGLSALLRAGGETRYTIPNANVGDGNQGYVVDMNGNGQYNRGQDAIIGLDFDGDGNLSQNEMSRSRAMFGNWGESQYDRNHDGKISNEELNEAGGRSWVDKNRDGKIDSNEVGTVNDFTTNGPDQHRINELDPSRRRSTVSTEDRPDPLEELIKTRQLEPDINRRPTPPDGPRPWDTPKNWCPGPNDPILKKPNDENPLNKMFEDPKPKETEPSINDMLRRIREGPRPSQMEPGVDYAGSRGGSPQPAPDLGYTQPRGGNPQGPRDITYPEPARAPREGGSTSGPHQLHSSSSRASKPSGPKPAAPKPRSNAGSRSRPAGTTR